MGRSRVLCMFQWGHRSDKATMRKTRCVPLVGAAVPGCSAGRLPFQPDPGESISIADIATDKNVAVGNAFMRSA